MNTTEFEQMLGLREPWKLTEVDINHEVRQVIIKIACSASVWGDPLTGARLHIHDKTRRTWRHLDFWQYETILEAEVPRVKDPETGLTQCVQVPWAEPGSRWTLRFEAFALEVLRMASSLEEGRKFLRLNWETASRIMKRGVDRGIERRCLEDLTCLGFDEKSFLRGQSYVTVMSDVTGGRVLEVEPKRTKEAAQKLIETLPAKQQKEIKAVAMDRSGPYLSAVGESLPGAIVVHDPFHLAADLNKAVDKIRRVEHKELTSQGDQTLKGTKYDWLRGFDTMEGPKLSSFENLLRRTLRTARAWEHKEMFKGVYEQNSKDEARLYFARWYGRAMRSRLDPVKAVARSFTGSLERILNWYDYPISNAAAEGLNSIIQAIKTAARGFRNVENYRIRILFRCGKLSMRPDLGE
jgi:transposase